MGNRIEREKKVVAFMIDFYCRKKEENQSLCTSCEELRDYAFKRLDACIFGDDKTSCKKCPVHCYKPSMREKMREVMRFSGPRMIIYSPLSAIRHMIGK